LNVSNQPFANDPHRKIPFRFEGEKSEAYETSGLQSWADVLVRIVRALTIGLRWGAEFREFIFHAFL
jgi:hypothetical protein